jgi:hypothetical protein
MANELRLSEAVEQYLRARAARYSATTVVQDRFVTRRLVAAVGEVHPLGLRARIAADPDAYYRRRREPVAPAHSIRC